MSTNVHSDIQEAALPALPDHVPPGVHQALAEAKARLQATYGNRLRHVILYGSRARGDAREDSDVDVLVVLKGPIENSYQEIKRAGASWGDLFSRYRLSFSFMPYTEEAYQDLRRPFMQNVHAEGIDLLA